MAVIAVTGGPGAPGATSSSLALLLAWPLAAGRKVLLVECDPDGGAALAGALEGRVEAVYGLRNLAVADRRGLLAEALWEQLIDVSPGGSGDRLLLPGLTDPAQAAGLAYTWEPLMETLRGLHDQGYDVLLDLGRSGAFGQGAVLVRRADCVAATVRTTLRGLSVARPRLAALREDLAAAGTGVDGLGLLLVGEGPYPASDVTRELELPVHGVLPYAPRPARVLSDGGDSTDRRFVRSELMRAARTVADRLATVAREQRQRLTPRPAVQAAPVTQVGPVTPVVQAVPAMPSAASVPSAQESAAVGYGWEAAQASQVPQASQAYPTVPEPSGYVPAVPYPGVQQGAQQGYAAAGAGDGWGGPVPGTTESGVAEPVAFTGWAPEAGGAGWAPDAAGAGWPPETAGAAAEPVRTGWAPEAVGWAPEAEAMDSALQQQAWPDGWTRPAPPAPEAQPYPVGEWRPDPEPPVPPVSHPPRDIGIAGLARVMADPAYAPEPGTPAQAEPQPMRSWFDSVTAPTGGAADLTPVPPGASGQAYVSPGGQAFASPAGQVFVPQAGPVQVRPGTGPYPPAGGAAPQPPLAGIAPHPAAPEPFPAPAEETETQGEVLRAR